MFEPKKDMSNEAERKITKEQEFEFYKPVFMLSSDNDCSRYQTVFKSMDDLMVDRKNSYHRCLQYTDESEDFSEFLDDIKITVNIIDIRKPIYGYISITIPRRYETEEYKSVISNKPAIDITDKNFYYDEIKDHGIHIELFLQP